MNKEILLERRGYIALMTLNRPDRLNAFNEAMWDALDETVSDLKKNLPRAVVITGAGDKAFSAGFDVNPDNPQVGGLVDAVTKKLRPPVDALIARIRASADGFAFLPVPIIAAINGLAYGGGAELASRCDIRILDPSVVLSLSEVKLGLIPDWGGRSLPHPAGRAGRRGGSHPYRKKGGCPGGASHRVCQFHQRARQVP